MNSNNFKHGELSNHIIKAFYKVYNILGYGFLEKVYESALIIELDKLGIPCVSQSPIAVLYDDNVIGEYFADILVQEQIIVEVKAAKKLSLEHEAQLLNYLKATKIEVGLLMNFGPKPEVRRKIYDNPQK